ncbi:hypothetical protein KY290_030757 [Solanum tuberosum]|uniref:Uncharacterized protein n=1 Tax=Solanum tuberosum TaxID=4113 RepID=A0ABQ7U766_SOLTU|nr:hypothetical protein KY290_030757 [Solanum tuberosum]
MAIVVMIEFCTKNTPSDGLDAVPKVVITLSVTFVNIVLSFTKSLLSKILIVGVMIAMERGVYSFCFFLLLFNLILSNSF